MSPILKQNTLKNSALLLINLQIDYCPGGAMEVPNGDKVIPIANELMDKFEHVIAVKDWHTANHISFAGNHPWRHIGKTITIDGLEQLLMPFHCVKETFGAHLHPSLAKEKITHTILQGTAHNIDDDNCFYDVDKRRDTGLSDFLNENQIEKVFIIGLATEAGVKKSALAAVDLAYQTFVIKDGCAAWNKEDKDEQKALKEMENAGVVVLDSSYLLSNE